MPITHNKHSSAHPSDATTSDGRPRSRHLMRRASRERFAAAAAERRRESIRERGREIVAADAKDMARRQRALKGGVSKYPKSGVLLLKAIFDEYDRDGSGYLSLEELTHALEKQKEQAQRRDIFEQTSLAGRQAQAGRVRGQPSDSEGVFLADFAESLFEALDANSDARVSFSELLHIIHPLATPLEVQTMLAWATPVKSAKQVRREEAEEAERQRLATLRAMFAVYDRDKDGKVSITEFRMAMLDHENWEEVDDLFDKYDANGNGEVDFDEFCAIVSPDL